MSVSGPATQPVHCNNLHHYQKDKVKLLRLKQELQRRAAIQQNVKESARKTQLARERKESQNAERILIGLAREEWNKDRRQRIHEAEQNRKRNVLVTIVAKDANSVRKKAVRDFEAAKAKEQRATEWINKKYEASKQQAEKEIVIKAIAKADLKKRAAKRQDRVERLREHRPVKLSAEKQKAERVEKLVKKFATIWLNKTRAKVRARAVIDRGDNFHQSAFIDREGRLDPVKQAEADLMKMEPAMKVILTIVHKEKTQAMADYFVSSVSRKNSKLPAARGSAELVSPSTKTNFEHLPKFSRQRLSSLAAEFKEYEKPIVHKSSVLT